MGQNEGFNVVLANHVCSRIFWFFSMFNYRSRVRLKISSSACSQVQYLRFRIWRQSSHHKSRHQTAPWRRKNGSIVARIHNMTSS